MDMDTQKDWMKVVAALADRLAFFGNRFADIAKLDETDPKAVHRAKKAAEMALRYPNPSVPTEGVKWACEGCGRAHDDDASTIQRQRVLLGLLASRVEGLKAELHHSPMVVRAEREGRHARRAGRSFHDCPYHAAGDSHENSMDVELGMIWREAWLAQDEIELLKDFEVVAREYIMAGVPSDRHITRVREAMLALDEYRAHL